MRESSQRQHATMALFVATALGLAGCKSEKASAHSDDRPVTRPVLVQTVAFEDSVSARTFVGTIRPRIESDLGFRVTGKVAKRLVNVGDAVRDGQPLATLDEIDLNLQVEQAQAEKKAAMAAVSQADADLTRTTTLAGKGWMAKAAVDRQKSTTEEARSRLLRADRALHLAEHSMGYAVLKADADGVVTATMVEPGQIVSAGQGAIRLAHTAEKEAVVAIPESLLRRARKDEATLTLWSNPGKTYHARLRELAPAADPATRTFLARFTILDQDDAVRFGMTTTLTLKDTDAAPVVRLPLTALLDQGKGPSVWVVDDQGKLALKRVRVAGYQKQEVLVAGGIAKGDQVVTMGAQKLDREQRVRAVDKLEF